LKETFLKSLFCSSYLFFLTCFLALAIERDQKDYTTANTIMVQVDMWKSK
jgi:hypothetical protein